MPVVKVTLSADAGDDMPATLTLTINVDTVNPVGEADVSKTVDRLAELVEAIRVYRVNKTMPEQPYVQVGARTMTADDYADFREARGSP